MLLNALILQQSAVATINCTTTNHILKQWIKKKPKNWFGNIPFTEFTSSVWFLLQLHSNSDKGDGSVRYILSGEGAGTIFLIDEVTGDIHATKSLDRERKTHYVLHAQALDRNTEEALEPKSEFIIKVQDINDNAPKFPDGPFVATVPEMSEVGE